MVVAPFVAPAGKGRGFGFVEPWRMIAPKGVRDPAEHGVAVGRFMVRDQIRGVRAGKE